jgi:hypothetical protein
MIQGFVVCSLQIVLPISLRVPYRLWKVCLVTKLTGANLSFAAFNDSLSHLSESPRQRVPRLLHFHVRIAPGHKHQPVGVPANRNHALRCADAQFLPIQRRRFIGKRKLAVDHAHLDGIALGGQKGGDGFPGGDRAVGKCDYFLRFVQFPLFCFVACCRGARN